MKPRVIAFSFAFITSVWASGVIFAQQSQHSVAAPLGFKVLSPVTITSKGSNPGLNIFRVGLQKASLVNSSISSATSNGFYVSTPISNGEVPFESAIEFQIGGQPSFTFNTNPVEVTYKDQGTQVWGAMTLTPSNVGSVRILDAGGKASFGINGILSIPPGQHSGIYSATVVEAVDYN